MSTSTDKTGPAGHQIELVGEWDLSRKEELKRLFDSIQKDGPLTIDLRRVTYADSTFLHALGSLAVRLEEVPITLRIAHPNLRRLLAIVNLEGLFRIVDEG